jgi:hypothetical protein
MDITAFMASGLAAGFQNIRRYSGKDRARSSHVETQSRGRWRDLGWRDNTFHNAGVLRAMARHTEHILQRSNVLSRSSFQWLPFMSLHSNVKRKISEMISMGKRRHGEIKAR